MKEDVSEIGIQRLASNWIARHSSYPMRIYYSNQMFWESFLFANADTSTIANPFFSNPIPPPVSSSSVPVDLMNGKRSRKWNSGVPSQRSSWYINIRSDVTRGINILQMCIIRSKKKKKNVTEELLLHTFYPVQFYINFKFPINCININIVIVLSGIIVFFKMLKRDKNSYL